MLLSALYVRYRDVQPIWDVVAQMLFYASPILYVVRPSCPSATSARIMATRSRALLSRCATRSSTRTPRTPGAAIGGALAAADPAGDHRRRRRARGLGVQPRGPADRREPVSEQAPDRRADGGAGAAVGGDPAPEAERRAIEEYERARSATSSARSRGASPPPLRAGKRVAGTLRWIVRDHALDGRGRHRRHPGVLRRRPLPRRGARRGRAQRTDREVELLIVDSGSTDGSLDIAEAHGARIHRIEKSEFSATAGPATG